MGNLDLSAFLVLLMKNKHKFRMGENFLKKYTFEDLNHKIVRNYGEIVSFADKNKDLIDLANEINRKNIEENIHEGIVHGICCCCDKEADFVWKLRPKYSDYILFTEVLFHKRCHMNTRQRAVIHIFKIFENNRPKNKKIYLYERTTAFYENFINWWGKNNEIIGSEYMGPKVISGQIVSGIRHEDSTNLSFKDNSFDYMISNDVFEHVPDIDLTLSEAKRCLKPGGKLIFRIPVEWFRDKTIKRAELINGEYKHLEEPIYHGGFQYDGSDGSLLVYNFGKDIFEIMKKAGFSDSYGIAILDKKYSIFATEPVVVFVCEK